MFCGRLEKNIGGFKAALTRFRGLLEWNSQANAPAIVSRQ
jgi:hypothetical protein